MGVLNMPYMQQPHFRANVTLWCSRNDTQIFTSIIFHMNIIFIAQWLLSGNSEILHCSDVFEHCQKLRKPENVFKQTRVNFCYCANMRSFLNYITATLTTLFAWRGSHVTAICDAAWFIEIHVAGSWFYSSYYANKCTFSEILLCHKGKENCHGSFFKMV